MLIGRGHNRNYEAGVWTEKKVTPEKREVHFAVKRRRAGRAPEGSGAPVGTSHHWFILADQVVTKIDANTYTTELHGDKYMLAYQRTGSETWSAGERGRRSHLIKILRRMMEDLESEAEGATARPLPLPKAPPVPKAPPAPNAKRASPATPVSKPRRRRAA